MNNKKNILKKILSFFPYFDYLIRKFYTLYNYGSFFIPLDLKNENILNNKCYRLNNKNFNKYNNRYKYFLISRKRNIFEYSKNKLDQLIDLVKKDNPDVAYDGNDYFNTEICSTNFLKKYKSKYSIEKYPVRFFYFINNSKIRNIGSNHREFNFNGTFKLPSGGRTIGDGGDVKNRLNFIPDLSGKTFLDIGSEEGYAVFDAITKNAKFAKGLNIEESKEYDHFPENTRPDVMTSRDRNQINITQKFLIKEYNLEKDDRVKFEYNNIYNLSDETFDFVFCFGVLYHLKNPYLALENLYRVTQETLIIETQGIKNDKYLNAKVDKSDGFIRHSSNALKHLLLMVGFKKVIILVDAYNPSMKTMNIVLKAEK